jgi:hypothetical protein
MHGYSDIVHERGSERREVPMDGDWQWTGEEVPCQGAARKRKEPGGLHGGRSRGSATECSPGVQRICARGSSQVPWLRKSLQAPICRPLMTSGAQCYE